MMLLRALVFMLIAAASLLAGCAAAALAGAMAQSYEDTKEIEVLPKYEGLPGHTLAVLVHADLSTLYEYPDLHQVLTSGISDRIGRDVINALVLDPSYIVYWQYSTPDWQAMPYSQIADQLKVERLILVDVFEYRLHPPGNRWEWEGVCAANVSIVEREGIDPDSFVDSFPVESRFPNLSGIGRESATRAQIETGVLAEFIKQTTWLFHKHKEPKHPDRMRARP